MTPKILMFLFAGFVVSFGTFMTYDKVLGGATFFIFCLILIDWVVDDYQRECREREFEQNQRRSSHKN